MLDVIKKVFGDNKASISKSEIFCQGIKTIEMVGNKHSEEFEMQSARNNIGKIKERLNISAATHESEVSTRQKAQTLNPVISSFGNDEMKNILSNLKNTNTENSNAESSFPSKKEESFSQKFNTSFSNHSPPKNQELYSSS